MNSWYGQQSCCLPSTKVTLHPILKRVKVNVLFARLYRTQQQDICLPTDTKGIEGWVGWHQMASCSTIIRSMLTELDVALEPWPVGKARPSCEALSVQWWLRPTRNPFVHCSSFQDGYLRLLNWFYINWQLNLKQSVCVNAGATEVMSQTWNEGMRFVRVVL